ncbi:MAG TPA: hypothetical protein VFX06_12045 [Stellaceae bacterium]|nr:hypothetical protein [Stellaceae bacterium]
MTGRHKFSDLDASLSPARRARVERMTSALAEEVDRDQPDERREALLELLKRHPDGLTRSQILEKLGIKGNGPEERSIGGALNALEKRRALAHRGDKYHAA